MIETTVFAIAPSATARILAGRRLERRWWLFVLPVAAALVAAIADIRWLFVALIMVFMIWPAALFFVWTGAAVTVEAARASLPHSIAFSSSGLHITYKDSENYRTPAPEFVPWSAISGREERGRIMIFYAGTRLIAIPLDALQPVQWQEIVAMS